MIETPSVFLISNSARGALIAMRGALDAVSGLGFSVFQMLPVHQRPLMGPLQNFLRDAQEQLDFLINQPGTKQQKDV